MNDVLFGFLPSYIDMILRLVLAGTCGFAVGLERKMRSKEAGVRTHTIVAIGSCLMTILSKYGFGDVQSDSDSTRIVAQVVSGIGFLGGGIIVYAKGALRGLTTAAGVWTTAGIGMAVGTGLTIMIVLALVVSVLVIATHLIFRVSFVRRYFHSVTIKFSAEEGAIEKIKGLFKNCKVEKLSLSKTDNEWEGKIILKTSDNATENALFGVVNLMPFIKFIEFSEEEI